MSKQSSLERLAAELLKDRPDPEKLKIWSREIGLKPTTDTVSLMAQVLERVERSKASFRRRTPEVGT